jgi:hypothetical protein
MDIVDTYRLRPVIFLILYVALVGSIWNLWEASTFFAGDQVKGWLGSGWWLLFYVVPLLIAVFSLNPADPHKQQESYQLAKDLSTLAILRRQEGGMCPTIDELSQSSYYQWRTAHATPARNGHTGVSSVSATVFAPGLAACAGLAPRGDSGPRDSDHHRRLTGNGAGGRTPLHELSPGSEPGQLVGPPSQQDSLGEPSFTADPVWSGDCPGSRRYRRTPEWPQDHGQGLLSRCGAIESEARHPLFRPEMGLNDALGARSLEPAGVGAAVSHRPVRAH